MSNKMTRKMKTNLCRYMLNKSKKTKIYKSKTRKYLRALYELTDAKTSRMKNAQKRSYERGYNKGFMKSCVKAIH